MNKEATYEKLVVGIANSVRNRTNALPVGMGIEEVNFEGQIKFGNGDTIQFAVEGVHPFISLIYKVNNDEPICPKL